MKMSLHRILSEIKLMDAKIDKKMQTTHFVGWKQKGKLVCGAFQENEFDADSRAGFMAVSDLIVRKNTLKQSLSKANSDTQIIVAGKSMTIADAVVFKHMLPIKKRFLETLKEQQKEAQQKVLNHNHQIEANALQLAQTALGKDNVKLTDSDAVSVSKPYIETNELKLHDPLSIKKKIEALEEEIDRFEADIDTVLSEANATTFIDID